MKLLVLDAGGTEVKYCTMDDSLTIENEGHVPTPRESGEDFLNLVKSLYDSFEGVEGIACSLPGIFDTKTGFLYGGGALTYFHGRNVAQLISEKCGCHVHVENDGKAAAIAELKAGTMQGITNGAVFIIGTAVGGGLIINGEVLRGPTFKAGEFSYIVTERDGWDNYYNTMCYNCATTGLMREYQLAKGLEAPLDGRTFFSILPEDEIAQDVLKKFCRSVAVQIFNMGILLDLQKVAIGGGISRQPILVETINECAEEMKTNYSLGHAGFGVPFPEIVRCEFMNGANLVGAFLSYKYDL